MAEAVLLAAAEEERLRNGLRLERRLFRQSIDPTLLPDNEFVGHFRLRKSQYETLCEELIPLMPVPQRSLAVRPEIKILAALAYYANGCYQKNIGAYRYINLCQTSVSDSLRDVTEAINNPQILGKYIHFPTTRVEREIVSRRFMQNFAFPGVVGCIDGTHVAIVRPHEDEEAYFSRKQYHSLNVMIICDADLRIMHVDASFGGQSHDSHVWNSSEIKDIMQEMHNEREVCWLLGDSGYAQRPWLMTPILNAAPNSPEEWYTNRHVRTRNVVERCIGVLKTRWRCLLVHRVMHYAPIKAGKIVNACVVLHNLVNDAQITIDADELSLDQAMQPAQQHPSHRDPTLRVDGGREAVVDRLWRSRDI